MMTTWRFTAKPYGDETLSSWLVRIAQMNYTHLYALFSHSNYKRSIYKNDLDLIPFSSGFYKWLSEMTGVSVERIRNMSLRMYEGYVQERITHHPKQAWIITMGQFKAHGYRFCPECLQEHLYFRKEWRLLFANACSRHNVYLSNHCDACMAPIVPQFINENNTLVSCYRCGHDLRNNKSQKLDEANDYLRIQRQLTQIADQGYYIMQNKWHYSIGLFETLHQIVLFFARKRHAEFNHQLKHGDLCMVEPRVIAEYIRAAIKLLDRWPIEFQKFCRDNRISNHFRLFDKFPWEKFPLWFVEEAAMNFHKGFKNGY